MSTAGQAVGARLTGLRLEALGTLLSGRLVLVLAGLAGLVTWARWETRSRFLFDLDSIQYARALDTFDLRLLQPPLPGYFLYIQFGRAVRLVAGDANLSLVWLSALLGLLLVGALALLARELFDAETAAVAALLGLTGPIYWYQSSFASPRIAEGFFATLIVWLCARVRRRADHRAFWVLVIALAIGGGVRQQTLIYLTPLAVWATWRVPFRTRVAGAVLGTVLIAGWLLPTLGAAGGWAGYQALSAAQFQTFVVNGTGVLQANGAAEMGRRLAQNLSLLALYAVFTCLLGTPLCVLALRHPKQLLVSARSMAGQALLLGTVPALGFLALVHIQQIGHALAVAPFLTLVLARVLVRRISRRWRALTVAILVGSNLLFVSLAPARLVGERVGSPSIATIGERDAFVAATTAAVRALPASETLVVTSPLSYGFVEQYTAEYRYIVVPRLFDTISDGRSGTDRTILTNGLRPTTDLGLVEGGRMLLPTTVRYIVTVGYERDIAAMLSPTTSKVTPDPSVPSLAVIGVSGPAELAFAPGRLQVIARVAPAR